MNQFSTAKVSFQLGVKCPAEGVIVVCKDLSDSFLVKTWHKDCQEGTPSVRRKPIDCVFCSKQDVCSLLWEGPREIRESQAWLRAQLTILPKWFSTDRSIGACAVGDVTVCGSCRTQRQLWSIWQYELAVGTCGCNTCTDCRLKYNLRGQECKCTLNDLGELAKCERCKLMLKKRWLKVTSFKGVWQTRKSETSLGCLAKDKIMAEWDVNPLALISNTEKAFLWERLLCSGGPVPRDSDPLVKGGVLDVTLARDSDLDLWKEVIRDPVYEKGHPVSYKTKGVYKETSMHEMITDLIKEMSFQEEYPIYMPREYSHYVRETSLTVRARSQQTFVGTDRVKIKMGLGNRSELWEFRVHLTTTSDFLGVGKAIEGVKLIRSSITKPSSLSRMTIWIRQKLGKV
ncbi:uncharacterized protein LOC120491929 [Pimephales promelas]|uniref:uncharacterized protein LOC120491929 n=1 Tax=Pimephales promelas TaxID=90988 RepID=UPI001955C1BC|nr:uncharacterized protein LOC120491929 [Pimephales promelas]